MNIIGNTIGSSSNRKGASILPPHPGIIVTQNYATISELTAPETADALTLAQHAIDNDYYYNLVCLHLFMGSSLAKKVFNFVDPEDSDAAQRLTNTGVSDHAKGVEITSGGISQFMLTHLDPTTISGSPHLGGAAYIQSISNYFQYTGSGTTWHLLHYDPGTSSAFPRIGTFTSSAVAVAGGNQPGLWIQQRPDNTKAETYHEGILKATNNDAFDVMDAQEIKYVLGMAGVMSMQAIFRAMTPTKLAAFNAGIQAFMTARGRHI